jgi:predicted DNA-binding mobile mystery protein A
MKPKIRNVLLTGLDARLAALKPARASAMKPARGWLRAVRTALGLSQAQVAKKFSITRQSYEDVEAAEERGAISLNSLQRAAAAMDCELIYFVLPRDSVAHTFSRLAQLQDPDFKHFEATEHSMALEGQAVGDLAPKRKS